MTIKSTYNILPLLLFLIFSIYTAQTTFKRDVIEKSDTLNLQDYPSTIILSDSLKETSGLQFIDGSLYTFNDSGGKPKIYKLNPKTGAILQTIKLNRAKNIDWEAMTYDGENIYIGDFGNNLGTRKDLTIYKFKLSKINPSNKVETVTPVSFKFGLDDQYNFSNTQNKTTNYDIESMIFYNDQLHIFTKEWTSGITKHHTLETYYKFQYSKLIESFNAQGMVTDATLKDGKLVLIGYTKEGLAFLYTFTDFKNGNFFNGNIHKTILGFSPSIGQMEGITIGEEGYFLSGEDINMMGFSHKQVLYYINPQQINNENTHLFHPQKRGGQ